MRDPGPEAGQVPKERGIRGYRVNTASRSPRTAAAARGFATAGPGTARRSAEAVQRPAAGLAGRGPDQRSGARPQSDVVDIAQGEQQSAHQQKGQQPGAQSGGRPRQIQCGSQIGPKGALCAPTGSPARREQCRDCVGPEPVQGVQAIPASSVRQKPGSAAFFIYHSISTPFRLGRRSVQPVPPPLYAWFRAGRGRMIFWNGAYWRASLRLRRECQAIPAIRSMTRWCSGKAQPPPVEGPGVGLLRGGWDLRCGAGLLEGTRARGWSGSRRGPPSR